MFRMEAPQSCPDMRTHYALRPPVLGKDELRLKDLLYFTSALLQLLYDSRDHSWLPEGGTSQHENFIACLSSFKVWAFSWVCSLIVIVLFWCDVYSTG